MKLTLVNKYHLIKYRLTIKMSGVVICQEKKQMFRKANSKTEFHLNFSNSALHQRDIQ